jgi:hypothetical protein
VYFYHPHYLYHHDFSELFHHDLISTLGKGQNNVHEDGRPDHSYHTKLVLAEIHQPKSVHHFPMDNPFEYEHHHMSNKTIPTTDQQMKVTVFVHPSFRNLIGVVHDLYDSHHHHYEAVR